MYSTSNTDINAKGFDNKNIGLQKSPNPSTIYGQKSPNPSTVYGQKSPNPSTIYGEKAKFVFNKNVGRLKGLEIWRIEKFEVVPYPKEEYGKFYTNDSYIVLNTKEINGVLSHDIHFWLGDNTTPDESDSATIMTVHLDQYLGGVASQHRETQEHESALFLSYFKKGIRYLTGCSGGFNKYTSNVEAGKRLFRVTGKRNVRIRQVDLDIQSMNQNDYFILDTGRKIFIHPPYKMDKFQKTQANEIAKQIREQDHHGRASIHILDHPICLADRTEFFGVLRCKSNNPELPNASADDDVIEMKENTTITLYNASAKPGYFTNGLMKISTQPFTQDMLKSDTCSILDTGCGIFVWVGKDATIDDKSHAMIKAQEFIAKLKYPTWTQIHRIVEGRETVQFKQYFSTWRETQPHRINHKSVGGFDSVEFDPTSLNYRKKAGKGAFMPDDNGKGNLELWLVQKNELIIVRQETRGMFFEKNCYVIKYSSASKKGGGDVVYFWQGKQASLSDKGTSALLTVNVAPKMKGGSIHVLVNQGYEPRHFLKIFLGKLIVLFGSHEEFLKNKDDNIKPGGIRLFKVRGTTEDNCHAEQVNPVAASLVSDDTFIVFIPNNITYIWEGAGASKFEKAMALESVERLTTDTEICKVIEGSEPDKFWKALGGKGNYDRELDKPGPPFLDARLFHCNLMDGKFVVSEILNFFQDDLNSDDVFIMDGGEEIYVWEGKNCLDEEREKSMQLASTYIRTDPSARTPESVPIITIQQGNEPKSFKRLFPKWKNNVGK